MEAECCDHTCANREEGHGRDDKWIVISHDGNQSATHHGRDHHRDEQWQEFDASLDSTVTLNGLEVEGYRGMLAGGRDKQQG